MDPINQGRLNGYASFPSFQTAFCYKKLIEYTVIQ